MLDIDFHNPEDDLRSPQQPSLSQRETLDAIDVLQLAIACDPFMRFADSLKPEFNRERARIRQELANDIFAAIAIYECTYEGYPDTKMQIEPLLFMRLAHYSKRDPKLLAGDLAMISITRPAMLANKTLEPLFDKQQFDLPLRGDAIKKREFVSAILISLFMSICSVDPALLPQVTAEFAEAGLSDDPDFDRSFRQALEYFDGSSDRGALVNQSRYPQIKPVLQALTRMWNKNGDINKTVILVLKLVQPMVRYLKG